MYPNKNSSANTDIICGKTKRLIFTMPIDNTKSKTEPAQTRNKSDILHAKSIIKILYIKRIAKILKFAVTQGVSTTTRVKEI